MRPQPHARKKKKKGVVQAAYVADAALQVRDEDDKKERRRAKEGPQEPRRLGLGQQLALHHLGQDGKPGRRGRPKKGGRETRLERRVESSLLGNVQRLQLVAHMLHRREELARLALQLR